MVECIDKILSISSEISIKEFKADWIKQDAIIRNLEIIGEAANAIDIHFKESYDQIPWKQIKGMRNI
ncbi:DUF86 domain-containing protein [Aquimarina sp. ERC-38]|nr:DUF86 domain-containing protein [Aquimarina sp. ERC-38]